MADQRVLRTRAKLLEAITELASQRAVEDVSVREACDAAGISTATFYRHATSPADFLVKVLRQDLDARRREFVVEVASSGLGAELGRTQRASILELARHLLDHADIYAHSMRRGRSALRHMLHDHLAESALEFLLTVQHEIEALGPLGSPGRRERIDAYAMNFAGGQLGLATSWITSERRDVEVFEELVLELLPEWNRRLIDA